MRPATGPPEAAPPAATAPVKTVQTVRRAPVDARVPVQPTASALQAYFAAYERPTVIAPRARYPKGALPEGLRQIGHDKQVRNWQAVNFPAEFKRVLIVG